MRDFIDRHIDDFLWGFLLGLLVIDWKVTREHDRKHEIRDLEALFATEPYRGDCS